MLLYLESVALAGRDWRTSECGGHATHTIRDLYYMSPEHPNCYVEIGSTFTLKQRALDCLGSQLAFTAQSMKTRLGDDVLRHIVPDYDALKENHLELGRALHHEMDKALAMSHGVLSHSGAAMAEAFRHQGPFTLNRLM